ncbi:ATP-binding protein [Sphingomonas sp.]|uniref:ATP-binding protein n=1 Tax=Sphingomonas sp. TaxID=28214 RepID=UPI002C107A96|nr:ATP-binding protein [Sphingomonas sp.]HWK36397.1 ATP-binding protein [Sphingomonas sp.]
MDAGPLHAYWRAIIMLVVAVLSAGVMIALIVTLNNANRARDQALSAQSHSYEVMILTRRLSDTMARAEATLGRFVISADKSLGQRFSEQWQQAGNQIDRLDSITNDNPTQQGRVFALRQAYRERGEELSLIALSTQYRKNDQALARYYQARDAAALQRIDTLLDGFTATERNLLDTRTAAANAKIEWSNRAAKVFAAFGGLLVLATIASGWLAVRASNDRIRAAAEAEAERLRAGELEAAVAVATDELHAESREREAAEAKLRQMQKLEAVGQLTGGIAHDFNNMLAVVLGGIELARRRVGDSRDEVLRHLDSAAEGANRASALTRRLLAFARAEPLLPQSVDPGALLRGMSDLLDRTLGDAISVDATGVQPSWHVWVDRDGFENAILNLAVNARDAMDGRGRLTIATGSVTLDDNAIGHCAAGDYAAIAIGDSGCGMTPEVLERVFEPFFTTKPVGKGTGLGLSQVFGFARQSQGEVGIASTPGRGTVVTIYLPRHIAAATADDTPLPAGATVTPGLSPAARTFDILVVEDDRRVLAATVGLLRELGHRAVPCADSMAATTVAASMPALDLVISDVLMPGKTGPELIAELSASLPDVAALFVTGYGGDAHEAEGFGDHPVLRKPFTIAGLAAAIDGVMAGRSNAPGPIAAAG